MYRLLAIGLSAGGYPLILRLLAALPEGYPLPVAIVAHLPEREESILAELFDATTRLPVSMASDKAAIQSARVYVAPPGYHLLVEQDPGTTPAFALSVDEPVNSVRPSISEL